MSDNKREQLAREAVEVYNRADWPGARALVTPGFVYDETGSGRHVEGPDQYIEALKAWKDSFPDATGEITRVVVDGDTSVVEVIWRGTQQGPLPTPSGTIPATGRTVELWATLWGRWEGELLAEARHHIDILTLLAQIGALPQ